jgi:hypothetical protein
VQDNNAMSLALGTAVTGVPHMTTDDNTIEPQEVKILGPLSLSLMLRKNLQGRVDRYRYRPGLQSLWNRETNDADNCFFGRIFWVLPVSILLPATPTR